MTFTVATPLWSVVILESASVLSPTRAKARSALPRRANVAEPKKSAVASMVSRPVVFRAEKVRLPVLAVSSARVSMPLIRYWVVAVPPLRTTRSLPSPPLMVALAATSLPAWMRITSSLAPVSTLFTVKPPMLVRLRSALPSSAEASTLVRPLFATSVSAMLPVPVKVRVLALVPLRLIAFSPVAATVTFSMPLAVMPMAASTLPSSSKLPVFSTARERVSSLPLTASSVKVTLRLAVRSATLIRASAAATPARFTAPFNW